VPRGHNADSDSVSIATDIIEICDYSSNNVLGLLSDWPFSPGLGLFATKPIKRGVYIATYRGRRITTEEADRREARGAKYQFEINKRWTIDGSPRWNVARYINHSCRPNAKPVGRRGGIVIVALRRIEPEEEITYNYGRQYVEHFLENGGCRCAACRRKRALHRRRTRRRKWTT
jgi:SET domain-containing protein